jgi:hypothetical protein
LIWFSVLLVVVVPIISQSKEYHLGRASNGVFAFAIAVLGLCALIALGMISAKVQRATSSFSTSFDRI